MSQNSDLYVYRARLNDVTDGDTFSLVVDLGFGTTLEVEVELAGVDTAEISGPEAGEGEYEKGHRQRAFAKDYLTGENATSEYPLILRGYGKAQRGRWAGDIRRVGAEKSLREALTQEFPEVEAD
jgi:endonuclease YncB( thermonuclease family)